MQLITNRRTTIITFNTQEDFENAVMDVLKKRLWLQVTCSNETDYYGGNYGKVDVELIDSDDNVVFTGSRDSITL